MKLLGETWTIQMKFRVLNIELSLAWVYHLTYNCTSYISNIEDKREMVTHAFARSTLAEFNTYALLAHRLKDNFDIYIMYKCTSPFVAKNGEYEIKTLTHRL